MHADPTPEQIVAAVGEAWEALSPYFEVADPTRELPDVSVAQIEEDLRELLRTVRVPKATISVYLPYEVWGFHAIVDRTVISQSFGWWDLELFGRRTYAGPNPELEEEEREAVLKHGLWHCLGRFNDKHALWTCVERNRPEYGQIYDLNDGDPFWPGLLVPDRVFPSWLEFLQELASGKR